jgi:ABC-2 type transport system ATP-binding protein
MSSTDFLLVENLSHRYGERLALDRLSFTVATGEIFGLLGPNGSGKTTLFRILSTLLPLQDGTVTLDDVSLRYDLAGIRERLGVVFQSPSLDGKLTVRENLVHHGHLYGLHGAALRERIDVLTDKFKIRDRLKDTVETLSGGLQRRVEVAKGLLHRPALLILDEPTTGLDPAARIDLWTYLQEVNREEKITILVTTHLMDEAERCNRLMVLDRGLRVCLDSPQALKASISGAVITVQTGDTEALKSLLSSKLQLDSKVVAGNLRIEAPGGQPDNGPRLVAQIVAAAAGQVESITLSQPTLEDVFIHLTGRKFETASEVAA